jgi:translocation and assembly module TamB
VVFVKEEKAVPSSTLPASPYHMNTQITLEMGQDVAITVKGLKGFLTGTVQLIKTENKPLIANGELRIRDGIYKAYGQDLTITEGQFFFKDEDIDNPEIRLRAVRQFHNTANTVAASNKLFDFRSDKIQTLNLNNKTTLGIEVKGRLHANKVNLFSIPSNLSQADILSLLILGKPASQASSAGAQLLMAAVSNNPGGSQGTELLLQLKQSLGLDFTVEDNSLNPLIVKNNGKQNAKITSDLVIGKALSKRLYLSYNMGLSQQDNNKATLKYLLNQFFSLQVNASTNASGIDLLYTHQKD